jgi:hypothetical protein
MGDVLGVETSIEAPILVQFGNDRAQRCVGTTTATTPHEHAPLRRDASSVTYLHIPPGYTFDPDAERLSAGNVALHLIQNPDVTRLSNLEALLVPLHPTGGMWGHHGAEKPTWVGSNNAAYGELLAEIYDVPHRHLDDEEFHSWKEDTHHTLFGPPGVGPQAGPLTPRALKVNAGNDIQAALLGGGQVDETGQLTGATATTATKTAAGWTTNQWAGCRVYATVSATQMVWGLVISNTATVLTVDRWYTVGTPGGTTGTTPSTTGTYVIIGSGGPAAWFMGLTATATAPSATDTSLTGEITTAGGGLIRKICPYAHTAGASTYTLTPVFTANGTDALPVTVAQIGVFNSMVVADTTTTMLFRTLLNATATLSASGDQLTVTETVTM